MSDLRPSKVTLTERLERFEHWTTFSPWFPVVLAGVWIVFTVLYVILENIK